MTIENQWLENLAQWGLVSDEMRALAIRLGKSKFVYLDSDGVWKDSNTSGFIGSIIYRLKAPVSKIKIVEMPDGIWLDIASGDLQGVVHLSNHRQTIIYKLLLDFISKNGDYLYGN